MEPTLTIGDFSRATHLSVKMLRHYHDIGLLEPAVVDPDTGYRRYGTRQIATAQVIRNPTLRIADFTRESSVNQVGGQQAGRFAEQPQMILGMDFLRAHRVFVSNSQHKMYFDYRGGPLFQPRRAPAPQGAPPGVPPAQGLR